MISKRTGATVLCHRARRRSGKQQTDKQNHCCTSTEELDEDLQKLKVTIQYDEGGRMSAYSTIWILPHLSIYDKIIFASFEEKRILRGPPSIFFAN